jgi:hypothetical protein
MAMRDGHPLKRAGKEFARNLIWMLLVFGPLGAILIPVAHLPLLGVFALVGFFVSVTAAIMTAVALWSGAHDEALLSSHNHPGLPPEGRGLGGWDGGGGGWHGGEGFGGGDGG